MDVNVLHRTLIQNFSYLVRLILKLRYRVQVRGFKEIKALKRGKPGILFLPNHPAEIDPVILMSILGPAFFPRSMIVEHFYNLKGFKKILDFARVVPIPSMDTKANQWRGKELAKTFEKIEKEISEGENFIIYPSGKLMRSGLERIGGASLVYNLLRNRSDIPVVLVRTTGLWGSSFSTAQTGRSPQFAAILKRSLLVILKNFLFFVPKRKVVLEFEIASSELPRAETRLDFNRYLESWYNEGLPPEGEKHSFVPYFMFGKAQGEVFSKKFLDEEGEEEEISLEERGKVINFLAGLSSISEKEIHGQSHLSYDLGLDSLDIAQVHLFLDRKCGVEEVPPGSLLTVNDIFRAIKKQEVESGLPKEEKPKISSKWNEIKKRKSCFIADGEVIPEVFLRSCDRMGSSIACGDRNSGVFSYFELKRAALILSRKFQEFEGKRLGILLPSSVGAYLSILAALLAGKVPVMLNWTAGKIALGHAAKVSGFKSVITSKKFLDKIQLEDLSEIEERFVFLEDLKASISWREKLQGAFLAYLSASTLMKKLKISKEGTDEAVLLFTSGTETLPKAVPLTHRQILVNQKSAVTCSDLNSKDTFYGVLPPFHSFGFSLTGLFPLLYGLKVFYSPDPTDSRQMLQDIEEAKVSVFCSAPSFVRPLIAEADQGQLKTLRMLVLGAERVPKDLASMIESRASWVRLIEGYGITECSPVVTLQRASEERKGVGPAIPGINLRVIDPDSLAFLEPGKQGEVCISGPSVFSGYLEEGKDPFIYDKGVRWYRSGDLGLLDNKGNLFLTDRLKRMIKIGAEMISLGGLESELLEAARENGWHSTSQEGQPLAVIGRDGGNQKADIVLFTTFSVDKERVNQALRERGFGRIVKISEIVTVDEIPLTGTGKTHHRILEERFKGENTEQCRVEKK